MNEDNSYGLTTKGGKLLAYLEARQKYGDDVDDPEGKAIYEEVMQHIQRRREAMTTIDERTESVYLRCDCHAETLEFNKITWSDETDYEMNIVDAYCGGDFMGIANRFKRAWRAFWAKPICHASVYIEDPVRMKGFLEQCLALMEED